MNTKKLFNLTTFFLEINRHGEVLFSSFEGITVGDVIYGRIEDYSQEFKDFIVSEENEYFGHWSLGSSSRKEYQVSAFKHSEEVYILHLTDLSSYQKLNKEVQSLQRVSDLNMKRLLGTMDELNDAKKELESSLKVKEEFLAKVSHELRTPLTSIVGYSELLNEHIQNQEYSSWVQNIHKSANTLVSLINDLLDFSKLSFEDIELKKEEFTLYELFSDVRNSIHQTIVKKNLFLEETIKEGNVVIVSDNLRIAQVMINLISNAIKYTEVGGIYVRMSLKHKGSDNADLLIEIEDTGHGISSEELPNIFSSFKQISQDYRVENGVGLGLSIVSKIIELLSGEVRVQSKIDVGSTFFVRIPVALSEVQEINKVVYMLEPSMVQKKIIHLIAKKAGIELKFFSESNFKGEAKKYPLIIDFDDIDNLEIIDELKPKFKKIIGLVSNSNYLESGELYDVCDAVLQKPIQLKELERIIHQ